MGMIESKDRATSDPEARQDVLKRMEKEDIDYVLFWFTDIEGHLKSFAITLSELEGALDDGMGFDGSSITGFNAIEESDMVAIPDPATFRLLPAADGEAEDRPDDLRRRHARRRAVRRRPAPRPAARARADGVDGLRHLQHRPRARVLPLQGQPGTETLDEGGYFAMTALDAATELRNETIKALERWGSRSSTTTTRSRRPSTRSTCATRLRSTWPTQTVTYRLIVKEVAAQARRLRDLHAEAALRRERVGMHTHMSLFKDGRNQFFDGDDPHNLSPVGKQFIAGLLRHARELAPVFAQWVNSYKRLVPGYEAPVYVAWSQRNRSALIRIPLYKPGSEQATRAEIRCPDPACNPYLTFAALLHAGLEGIEQGYELSRPMETNLYHLTAEERREQGIVSLPETLGEAIDEFARSELMRSAFGDHIFDNYVELKRRNGTSTGPAHPVGARPLPRRCL